MRSPLGGLWMIVIAVVILMVANRFGRSFGPIGVLLPIIVAVVALWILRVNARAARWTGVDRWRPAQKDVTPPEPAIAPAVVARPQNPPPVIVVDPSEPPVEALETKLQALDRLRASGLVTEQEYEAKRASLIADF